MGDESRNFVPLDLGLDIPDIAEIRGMRRMPIGWSEGPATQISSLRRRYTAVELMFISRAFAATSFNRSSA